VPFVHCVGCRCRGNRAKDEEEVVEAEAVMRDMEGALDVETPDTLEDLLQ
jgi:hypothetical protein